MQRSTLYSFFSVLAASILLVGPYSAIHTVWNFGEAIGRLGQRERLNTKAATRQRVEMCESTADVYTSFVAATGGLISGGAPGTPPAIADSSRIQPPTSAVRQKIGHGLRAGLHGNA
jgi:hypothetical protein